MAEHLHLPRRLGIVFVQALFTRRWLISIDQAMTAAVTMIHPSSHTQSIWIEVRRQ